MSGKNINDYTHLTSNDNMKIIYWVGTLREEDEAKVNLRALRDVNQTHERLYSSDTLLSRRKREEFAESRPSTREHEKLEKWVLSHV